MKNLTKALVAYGLLLSISGCNQEVMDCIQDSSSNLFSINEIDVGGSPFTTNEIDVGGSPFTTNEIDVGGTPFTTNEIDVGGSPFTTKEIDVGGKPTAKSSGALDVSMSQCLSRINLQVSLSK